MKDLQPLIARVAVLRSQLGMANKELTAAEKKTDEARRAYGAADDELKTEIQNQIEALTQAPE